MLNLFFIPAILMHPNTNSLNCFWICLVVLFLLSIFIIKKNNLVKQKIKRLNLAKEIIDSLHENLNIQSIREISVKKMGIEMGTDRCLIAEYEPETKRFSKISAEYLSSNNILSLKGDLPFIQSARITHICLKNKSLNIPEIEKYINKKPIKDTMVESFYKKYKLKSILILPIRHSDKILGAIILHYTQKIKILTKEDILFIQDITNSIGIALHQYNLYENEKKAAQRNQLLMQITETIRLSLDINGIKQQIVNEIGKNFKADRCYLRVYNQSEGLFLKPDVEYLASPNIKSLMNLEPDQEGLKYFFEQIKNSESSLPIQVTQHSITDENIKDSPLGKYFNQVGIKSDFAIPIWDGEKKLTFLVLHYIKKTSLLKEEDVNLLITLSKQIATALDQSKMYLDSKQQAEREKISQNVVNIIRSSLELDIILKNVCNELLKIVDVQRIFIGNLDFKKRKHFIEIVTNSEIKKSSSVNDETFGLMTDFWIKHINTHKTTKIINNVAKSDMPEDVKNIYMNIMGVKSIICIPVKSNEEIWGGLFLFWTNNYHKLTTEEIEFLEGIVNQVGTAILQAELYEKEKASVKKELILRKIIEEIRSSIELDFVKHEIVFQVGNLLTADRVAFADYDIETGNYYILSKNEYRSSSDVKTFVGYDFAATPGFIEAIRELHLTGKDIIFNDLDKYLEENNLKESSIEKFYREMGFIASMAINISHGDFFYGNLVITFDKPREITETDVEFVRTLAAQAGIAIYQSNLYQKEKQSVQREIILKNIISKIRSSLDIEKIKHEIVSQIGTFFNANGVRIADYNYQLGDYSVSKEAEYISSENPLSWVGLHFKEISGFIENIRNVHLKGQDIIFNNIENYLDENNLRGNGIEKFYRDYGFVSSVATNIYHGDVYIGNFVITFEHARNFSDDEINFLKALADHAGTALYQAKLYAKEKQTSEREITLRETTKIIRGTLDSEEIKKRFVEITCKYFDADRCLFDDYDKEINKFLPFKIEVLKTPNIKSIKGVIIEDAFPEFLTRLKKGKDIIIKDLKKLLLRKNITGYKSLESLRKGDTKSDYGLLVKYKDQIMGILIIHFTENKRILTQDELDFLKVLRDQVGTALYQAELYEHQKMIANKERILKDIISEIKLTRDLHEAYNRLLEKLAEIFNLNRTLFLESSKVNPEELNIKYEYVINREDMTANNIIFPQVCIEAFLNLIHNLKPLILCDVADCSPEETSDFFKKYKIQALLSFPLIKCHKEIQVLGFIVLCSETSRIWTNEEIELMQAISDSVVSVIWEIAKFIETEELRDSFISTLAHDFQVPFIGEKTALEYMLNYSKIELGENREILAELLENNQNITALLDTSLDIYNYEAGKKHLDLNNYNIDSLLTESILLSTNNAKSKKIKINFQKSEEKCFIKADKKELLKVFNILIENAINHSPDDTAVEIEYYSKNNFVIIRINNKGKPIPLEIQEKIFNRYEMATAIERKIGAGTGLFLSKRITEAHKGAIWFETNEKQGTSFYVSLPLG